MESRTTHHIELDSMPLSTQENDKAKAKLEAHVIFVSITYILTIGVSGLILCAVGSNLNAIAANVGVKATALGGRAFMFRGCGAIFGAISSSYIYKTYQGDVVLLCGLLGIVTILTLIPYSTNTFEIYFYFFCLGICSSIDDTGCNIMMRKVHGKSAGPWLGMNGISFGMSAAVVPLVELISDDFMTQYHILAVLILTIAALVFYGTTDRSFFLFDHHREAIKEKAEEHNQLLVVQKQVDKIAPHFHVEVAIALMVFCFVGGQVDTVAYMSLYLDQTQVLQGPSKGDVLLIFWIFVSIGRFLGVLDQRSLTDTQLVSHLSICCAAGSASMLFASIFPASPACLWISIIGYSLFYGPTVAYCHDLNNRLTLPTEKSTSIVMFGINCGASFVPYMTSLVWEYRHANPAVLLMFLFLSMLLPLPITLAVKTLSYKKGMEDFKQQRPNTYFYYHSLSARRFKAAADVVMAVNKMSRLGAAFRTSMTGSEGNTAAAQAVANYGAIPTEKPLLDTHRGSV